MPQNGRNGPPTVETGVLLTGRGVAYRKTEETDFSSTSYGRNGGPIYQERCGVPQNGTPRATVHPPSTASLQPPRATVHPPSTSSSFHLRLFIHGLLFIQPPPRATPPASVQPAFHGPFHHLLFIQPSTPQGPVHPEATPPLTVHPNPTPQRSLFIQSIGFS